MQSVLMYGRILTRALANSVFSYSTCATSSDAKYAWAKGDLGLQTVTCGFPKERNRFSIGLGRGQFGDDACFAAKYKSFDVLGERLLSLKYFHSGPQSSASSNTPAAFQVRLIVLFDCLKRRTIVSVTSSERPVSAVSRDELKVIHSCQQSRFDFLCIANAKFNKVSVQFDLVHRNVDGFSFVFFLWRSRSRRSGRGRRLADVRRRPVSLLDGIDAQLRTCRPLR